jgi:thioredoxin-like negative regulator of GroEL
MARGSSLLRAAGAALVTLVAALPTQAADMASSGLQPLSADELSQVSAAGLPAQTVAGLARGGTVALTAQTLLQNASQQDQQAALERQLALNQLRLGTDNVRVATQLLQTVAVTGPFTPVSPVLMPMMGFPFSLAMPSPPPSSRKQ